jgi:hypothetical protein
LEWGTPFAHLQTASYFFGLIMKAITVLVPGRKLSKFNIKLGDGGTIGDLKVKLAKRLGWTPANVRLICNGAELTESSAPGAGSCSVEGRKIFAMFSTAKEKGETRSFKVKLKVFTPPTVKLHHVSVRGDMKRSDLFAILGALVPKEMLSNFNFSFYHKGEKVRDDSYCLGQLQVKAGSVLTVRRSDVIVKKNVTVSVTHPTKGGTVTVTGSFGSSYSAGAIKLCMYKRQKIPREYSPGLVTLYHDRTGKRLDDFKTLGEQDVRDGDSLSLTVASADGTMLLPLRTFLGKKKAAKKRSGGRARARAAKDSFSGFKKGFWGGRNKRKKKKTSSKAAAVRAMVQPLAAAAELGKENHINRPEPLPPRINLAARKLKLRELPTNSLSSNKINSTASQTPLGRKTTLLEPIDRPRHQQHEE